MGLTVHYEFKAPTADLQQARDLVHQMRGRARQLPFKEVGDIVEIVGTACEFEPRREELQTNGGEQGAELFWLLIQSSQHLRYPWNKHLSTSVAPKHIIAFNAWPGAGCESANFGLCLYPETVELTYNYRDDQRFHNVIDKNGFTEFSLKKWRKKRGVGWENYCSGPRSVPTELKGWQWNSCCKTQYASDPECGGIPNFLKCHIGLITALDRMAKLPGLKTRIVDEGNYGPGSHCSDYAQATAEGRKIVWRRHTGYRSPAKLANEVGNWNTLIAGVAGSLSDALGRASVDAPIKEFANFEQLEFRGRNNKMLEPFLAALDRVVPKSTMVE